MKGILYLASFLIICFEISSCLDDEAVIDATYNFKKIDSIQIGEIKPARQVTEIKTFFTLDNNCEQFFNYDYTIDGNNRTVAIVTSEYTEENCDSINEVDSFTLNFKPEESGTYTFRFWNGTTENDENQFIERVIEIP